MANVFDYIDWRGDLTLKQDPFNEVDNLVLSWLSYVELDDIMPNGICNVEVTIKDAAERYFAKHKLEDRLKRNSLTKTSALLFYKLQTAKRFCDMKIVNYVNNISVELQQQFSAMTFEVEPGLLYVAFRGTDDTIVGWREDFNMSFLPFVPSQQKAVEYVNESLTGRKEKIIFGGHSKGGNLAVYSGIRCDKKIQKKLIRIYNNDGPGFLTDILNSQEYQQMLPKITTIVPESSVIGMLLGHEESYEIVRSTQKGIMQHDAGTWEIMGKDFVYLDSFSDGSIFLNHSFKQWIQNLNEEQRKTFVDGLFQLLEAAGAKTTGELYTLGFKNVSSAVKVYSGMDSEMKQMLLSITKSLFDVMSANLKSSLKQR